MSLYSEVNKKMKKRNDMGVGVYGCMPCSGGEKKGIRPHKEKEVPGVGAMGYGFSRYFRQKLKINPDLFDSLRT